MIEICVKKPIEQEFIQLKPDNIKEVYKFIHGSDSVSLKHPVAQDKWFEYEISVETSGMPLKTLESDGETQTISMYDYVVKGVKGEFYPVKPDIFPEIFNLKKETSEIDKPDLSIHQVEGNFKDGLTDLINTQSIENGSNTPDFILAELLKQCLDSFDMATRERDKWYGKDK